MHFEHFLDTFLYIELADILPELICLDLSEIKQVLDKKSHHLCGGLVDLKSFVHLIKQALDLGPQIRVAMVLVI